MFLLQKHRAGLGDSVGLSSKHRPAMLQGHWPRSSPEKQTASTTKHICVQPSMCCEGSTQKGIKCIWKYHCSGESAMLICRKALLLSTARRDIFLLLIRQKNIMCAAVPENSFSALPCCFPLRECFPSARDLTLFPLFHRNKTQTKAWYRRVGLPCKALLNSASALGWMNHPEQGCFQAHDLKL